MKRFVFTIILIVSAVQYALATAQAVDYLYINGERHYILRYLPLEDLIDKKIPNDYKFPEFQMSSTANDKGYIAYWEIDNNKLYLTAIHDEGNAPRDKKYIDLDLEKIFGKECVNGRVHAKWVNQTLALGFGNIRKWYEGSGPITSYRKIVQVKNGRCKMLGEYEYDDKSIEKGVVAELSQEAHDAIVNNWKWKWSEAFYLGHKLTKGSTYIEFGVRNGKVAFKEDYWFPDRMEEYKQYIYKKIKKVDWKKYLEKDQAIYFTLYLEINSKEQEIPHFNIY